MPTNHLTNHIIRHDLGRWQHGHPSNFLTIEEHLPEKHLPELPTIHLTNHTIRHDLGHHRHLPFLVSDLLRGQLRESMLRPLRHMAMLIQARKTGTVHPGLRRPHFTRQQEMMSDDDDWKGCSKGVTSDEVLNHRARPFAVQEHFVCAVLIS
eukprot:gnl/TRDRNA2_/TRDRNA2_141463_c0_seq1.p1 gnl/TRDRNA2_/TRDRNA2_141463_c0~~gnl/TRDRNA2_/TRDRNA2_141463_c0_seq1.p1  ORF type:complete len:152 (+),score=8.27 gnl/TRDRNA2_/TRDRNA2_141463_c0_seq1:1-456(+)